MAYVGASMCVYVVFIREIKLRKRAQSADDEDSADLAESLQHLTLSEFLKECGSSIHQLQSPYYL